MRVSAERFATLVCALLLLSAPIQPAVAQSELLKTLLGVGAAALAEEARQQQLQQVPADAERGMDIRAVQERLNALGYNVGRPDGVMGARTRRAIADYQRATGKTPTGVLDAADFAALTGTPSAVAETQSTGGTFSLLYDVDLPYNDFRSGMSERGLKGTGMDGCMAACAADGRCQAFTYNLSARVCFLKTAGANPTPFSGAVSGIRSGSPLQTAPDDLGSRPLTPSEVANLQAGLNALGYDTGKPDGVAGARTRAAIARFVADNPSAGSTAMTARLLQAVLQSPGGSSDVSAVDPAAYSSFEDVDRILALLAIAREPAILDDRGLLERWFQRTHPSRASQPRIDYEAANSVEQDAILQSLREAIIDEATALAADKGTLPIRVRVWTPMQFNDFLPGKGIAFLTAGLQRTVAYRSNAVGREFVGATLNAPAVGPNPTRNAFDGPAITEVPILEAAEASAFLDRARGPDGNGRAELVAWYTITEIGTDRNLAGASGLQPRQVPITATLDKVSIATMRIGLDRLGGGEELYVLYSRDSTPSRSSSGGADPVLAARNMGLPIIDDHVLVPADQNLSYEIERSFGTNQFDYSIWRYYTLAALRIDPERAKDRVGDRDIISLLSPIQHLRVYGVEKGTFLGNFANEFERRRAARVFNEEVLPELLLEAPAAPLPVVSLFRIQVGEYDFSTGSFPLGIGNGRQLFALPQTLASSVVYSDAPATLPMSEAAAEQFILAARDQGRPWVWVATFGELSVAPTETTSNGSFNRISFKPTRSGIYAEPFLTTLLAEIDASRSVVDPNSVEIVPRMVTDSEAILASIVPTSELDLLGRAYATLSPRGQSGAMVDASRAVRDANEFDVAAARIAAEAALASAAARDGDLWLTGTIDVGTYDIEAGTFGTAGFGLAAPGGDSGYRAYFEFAVADSRSLASLTVPEALARQVVESDQRRVPILARVKVLDVTVDSSSDTPRYRFDFDLEEVLVWSRFGGDDKPPVLLARVEAAPTDAVLADVPPVTQLDQESLDYIRLKYAPDSFAESDFIRMMGARWAMERAGRVPDGTYFFPADADLLSAGIRERWLPEFTKWATARATSINSPLTLRVGRDGFACVTAIVGQYWQSPIRESVLAMYPELAAAPDLTRIAMSFIAAHETGPVAYEVTGYPFENPGCNTYISGASVEQLRGPMGTRSGAVVMIDTVALPGTDSASPERLDLSVEIDAVELADVPGGAPALVIKARFAGANVSDSYKSAAMTVADLEALRAELTKPSDRPENWDIVGLHPGLLLTEAEAMIREHMDVAAVFTRKPGIRTSPHFNNERVFVSADLKEAIGLVYLPGPQGDTVYVISREVAVPAGTMAGTVLDSLREKYGAERRADVHSNGFYSIWVSQEAPKSATAGAHCGVAAPGAWEHWILQEGDVDGIDPAVADYLQVRGYPWLPGPRDAHAETMEYARLDCGFTIEASKHLSGNSDVLNVQIIDFEGYGRAFDEAAQQAEQIDVKPETPKLPFAL